MEKYHKISDIGKEQPFQVPEDYFRDLPERIMKRCEQKEHKKSMVQIIKPAVSLAAMFIAVALIAYFAIQFIDKPEGETSYKGQDIAEAEYYDQYYNQNELMDNIQEEGVDASLPDSDQTKKYIEYLLNEDIDYPTLINELQEDQQSGKDNQ